MAAARSHKKSVQSVVLACEQCQCRNYTTPFNKKAHPQRFEIKKHCPRCNAHTLHRETK